VAGESEGGGMETGEHVDSHDLEAQLRRSILKRRAVRLARPVDKPDIPPGRQYVLFLLSRQTFAFDVNYVEEVFQIKSILPVPGTPPYVVGIASLRGPLISIIDLRHLCNLHEKIVMGSDKTLIVRSGSLRVGVMTDEVSGLEFIADAEIARESPTLAHIPSRFIEGLTRSGTIILNCAILFSMEALEVSQ
jgi:purine-binding chemotaxis protein CheW